MTAKRKPLGWAKDKIGKKIISRQFVSKREMKDALDAFWDARPKEVGDKLRTWVRSTVKK